jgi:opacity protein-like surface antigen
MTRTLRLSVLVLGALTVLLRPAPAAADLRLTPFAGVTFLDDDNKGTLGAAVTFGSLIGIEFEAARAWLGGFEDIDFVDVDAYVTTYMANAVVRLPTGPIQPYGSAGVGIVKVTGDVDIPFFGDVVSASASDVGWNLGGGLYLMPSENFGLRADVRRFQTGDLEWEDIVDIGDLPLPKFTFWRATAGVTIKF